MYFFVLSTLFYEFKAALCNFFRFLVNSKDKSVTEQVHIRFSVLKLSVGLDPIQNDMLMIIIYNLNCLVGFCEKCIFDVIWGENKFVK